MGAIAPLLSLSLLLSFAGCDRLLPLGDRLPRPDALLDRRGHDLSRSDASRPDAARPDRFHWDARRDTRRLNDLPRATDQGGCPAGLTNCKGICVNTDTDPENCGGCGSACGAGDDCVLSVCTCSVRGRCNGECCNNGKCCVGGRCCAGACCTGCCRDDNTCQPGANFVECGSGGAPCENCKAKWPCHSASCGPDAFGKGLQCNDGPPKPDGALCQVESFAWGTCLKDQCCTGCILPLLKVCLPPPDQSSGQCNVAGQPCAACQFPFICKLGFCMAP